LKPIKATTVICSEQNYTVIMDWSTLKRSFLGGLLALLLLLGALAGCGSTDTSARLLLELPEGAVQGSWSPDGSLAAVPAHNRIELFGPDGKLERRVSVPGIDLSALSCECNVGWSADGSELHLVTRPGPTGAKGSVAVVGVDGNGLRTHPLGVHVASAAWSPTGWPLVFIPRSTVYHAGRGLGPPQPDLWSLDSLDSQPRKILHLKGEEFDPVFQQSGESLLFVESRRGWESLWVVDADGRHPRRLVGGLLGPVASWSPDGRQIALAAARRHGDRRVHLYLVSRQNGAIRPLGGGAVSDIRPVWSPDGRWIAYATPEGTLERVHPDSTGRQMLLQRSGEEAVGLNWSPLGSPLAYALRPIPKSD
jgi:dipeptidyl aminopeptidase/acylaminoacyl peptidase